MSVITAAARRPVSPDLFADLTDSTAVVDVDGSLVRVTFTPDIDEATTAAAVALMTSTDDVDFAARADLAAMRENPETCACCVAVIGYLLGMEGA